MNGVHPLPNLIQLLYKKALQPFLFRFDAEEAHHLAVKGLRFFEKLPGSLAFFENQFVVSDPRLEVNLRTLTCPNPIGLAAGFDKAMELFHVLPSLGFGFLELGTITPKPQHGQTQPRLFRNRDRQALLNRMGFNNPGMDAALKRFQKKRSCQRMRVPLGLNIGKGMQTQLEHAGEDYLVCLEKGYPFFDYFALNVSSPNTAELRTLQSADLLRNLLKNVTEKVHSLANPLGEAPKPVFVKISPDNSDDALEAVVRAAVEFHVGIIATNATTDTTLLGPKWANEGGGLSGRPLMAKANGTLKRVYQLSKGAIPIIGVGGVFSAEDAYEKIRLGATLVQVYTGWIFEGPNLIPAINRGLLKLMERDGFKRIQDAIGTA